MNDNSLAFKKVSQQMYTLLLKQVFVCIAGLNKNNEVIFVHKGFPFPPLVKNTQTQACHQAHCAESRIQLFFTSHN